MDKELMKVHLANQRARIRKEIDRINDQQTVLRDMLSDMDDSLTRLGDMDTVLYAIMENL